MKLKLFINEEDRQKMTVFGIKQNTLKIQIIEDLYYKRIDSQLEISKITNASLPTVNKALYELIDEGVITKSGFGSSKGGRKPLTYKLRSDAFYVLTIKIGREVSELGILDLKNEFVSDIIKIRVSNLNDPKIIDTLLKTTEQLIEKSGISKTKIIATGIALTGLIDKKTGISHSNLKFSNKPINLIFSERLKLPVYVDNDARIMALAELYFGNAKGVQNALCINLDSSIGLGIIMNGKMVYGNSGFAGEFGHMQIKENGKLCYCGKKGCLETVASGRVLKEGVKKLIQKGQESIIQKWVGVNYEKITEELIINAVLQGDEFAIAQLSIITEILGMGIANLIHLFNPEVIILGGPLSRAKHFLTDPLKQALNKYTITKTLLDTRVVISDIQNNTALLGAMALVMKNIFENK